MLQGEKNGKYVKLKTVRVYDDVYEFDVGKRFVLEMEYKGKFVPEKARLTLLDKEEQTAQSMTIGAITFRKITKGVLSIGTVRRLREASIRHFDYAGEPCVAMVP